MAGEPSERVEEVKMRSLYSKITGGHWGPIEIASVVVNGQLDRVQNQGTDLQACL